MSEYTKVRIALPSGVAYELKILPPEGSAYPFVVLPSDGVSVMDLPHLASKLLEIHCATVDSLVAMREGT